jgi:hypothetical protein
MSWYIENLMKLISSPKHFFADMPKGSWKEASLSFALVTGWIIAFALTTVMFINSYIPTGLSLIDGIYGKKLLIVIFPLLVMGTAFFIMTLLILGGILTIALLSLIFGYSAALNLLLILLGGSGNIWEVFKANLYGAGSYVAITLSIFLMIAVKYKLLSISIWMFIQNLSYYCIAAYVCYLFVRGSESTHKVPAWRAWLVATIFFIILVLINVVISAKIMPKIVGFLA